jgi:nucleoside-diphosphate-sugar epimerase
MAILLNKCHDSTSAYNLLNANKIPCQFIHIDNNDANKFKSELISTFPQIYLKHREKKDNLLLGGYSDLNNFIQNFKNQKLDYTKIKNVLGWEPEYDLERGLNKRLKEENLI